MAGEWTNKTGTYESFEIEPDRYQASFRVSASFGTRQSAFNQRVFLKGEPAPRLLEREGKKWRALSTCEWLNACGLFSSSWLCEVDMREQNDRNLSLLVGSFGCEKLAMEESNSMLILSSRKQQDERADDRWRVFVTVTRCLNNGGNPASLRNGKSVGPISNLFVRIHLIECPSAVGHTNFLWNLALARSPRIHGSNKLDLANTRDLYET